MISIIRTFRQKLQIRLVSDRLDFQGDRMNISERTLQDIGLIRGEYPGQCRARARLL